MNNNQKANHPLQSYEWGEARREMGIEVKHFDTDEASFQLTIHPLPFTSYKIGYLPRSVFPPENILNQMSEFGQKNKLIFIKIEPDDTKILNYKLPTTDYQLQPSSHPLFPEWTQILDLNKSNEELLKSFHSKTRYNIRLAQKKGVIVREMSNDRGFEIFSKLYFETCKRQHYYGHTNEYHRIIWKHLKNEIAHILVAYYQDIPLAAYELFYFKNTLYYPYGGTSNEYRNLMASNLLMWESILLGKKLGATKFDMWGSLPPDFTDTNSWTGFTRFKEGYGTKFVQKIGSFDLVINPQLYKLYNLVYMFREKFLSLKPQR